MTSRHDVRARHPACTGFMFVVALALGATSAYAQVVDTIRQYQFEPAASGYRIVLKEVPRPVAGDDEVLVRVRATSLNRRDLNMLQNDDADNSGYAGGIPLSDGAGEVIGVGRDVTGFKVGDRVAGIFFEKWIQGAASEEALLSDRGGNAGGMLSELIVTHEDGLV